MSIESAYRVRTLKQRSTGIEPYLRRGLRDRVLTLCGKNIAHFLAIR
jgi:hypothetical protein